MIQNFKAYTKAKLTEPFTTQVPKTDDKASQSQPTWSSRFKRRVGRDGQPVMTNGVAVMVDVPKLDEKGQPVMTNVAVMVDQKVDETAHPARTDGLSGGH